MKKQLRTASLLATCMAVVSLATAAQAATPPRPAMNVNGAYVILGKNPGTGPVEFKYGWHNASQFAAPAAGYWIGIYQNTAPLHYVWTAETVFSNPSYGIGAITVDSMEMVYRDAVNALPPGDYQINFFVRSSEVPGTNVAEVMLPFTVK